MSRSCFSLLDMFSLSARHEDAVQAVVHLAIDVQDHYLYSQEDHRIAENIGKHIAPQFAGMGVPTYWVSYKPPVSMRLNALSKIVFEADVSSPLSRYVQPAGGDKCVVKTDISVVAGSRVHDDFQRAGHRIVVVSGFTAAVCVLESVCDLRALGYQVVVLEDGTDLAPYLEYVRQRMENSGAVIGASRDVFAALGKNSREYVAGQEYKID